MYLAVTWTIRWTIRRLGNNKSVFLHVDCCSRRITISNKLKRDECIHLMTAGRKLKMLSEFE